MVSKTPWPEPRPLVNWAEIKSRLWFSTQLTNGLGSGQGFLTHFHMTQTRPYHNWSLPTFKALPTSIGWGKWGKVKESDYWMCTTLGIYMTSDYHLLYRHTILINCGTVKVFRSNVKQMYVRVHGHSQVPNYPLNKTIEVLIYLS